MPERATLPEPAPVAAAAASASAATVLAPRYLDAFRCTGPACEENCCHGWRVELDAATVRRYRTQTRDAAMTLAFSRHIKAGPARNATGSIRLLPDGNCPFLDAERLCTVHARLGEAALSNTCSNYPRSSLRIDGDTLVHATPSCPQVARLLAAPDAMELVEVDAARAPRGAPGVLSSAPDASRPGLARHAGVLHQAAMQVLGCATHPVQTMLIGYGILLQRAERAAAAAASPAQADAALRQLCEQFVQPGHLALVAANAEQLRGSDEAQFVLMLGLLNAYRATGQGRPSFKALIHEALEGIAPAGAAAGDALAAFRAAEAEYFEPFDRGHRHILRHYAANDLWRTRFPLAADGDAWASYFNLAARLGLLRFLLVSIAAARREAFDAGAYAQAIYTLSRNIEHNRTFMGDVLAQFRAAGLATFGAMALMLTRQGG